jgi:hypothetical protein
LDVGEEAKNDGIDVAATVGGRRLKGAGIGRRGRITALSGATVGQAAGQPLSIIASSIGSLSCGPKTHAGGHALCPPVSVPTHRSSKFGGSMSHVGCVDLDRSHRRRVDDQHSRPVGPFQMWSDSLRVPTEMPLL